VSSTRPKAIIARQIIDITQLQFAYGDWTAQRGDAQCLIQIVFNWALTLAGPWPRTKLIHPQQKKANGGSRFRGNDTVVFLCRGFLQYGVWSPFSSG
jgi:hypothetical protein